MDRTRDEPIDKEKGKKAAPSSDNSSREKKASGYSITSLGTLYRFRRIERGNNEVNHIRNIDRTRSVDNWPQML